MMETLQLAQMLADLSDLNAADPAAANDLVSANTATAQAASTPAATTSASPSSTLPLPSHRRVSSSSSLHVGSAAGKPLSGSPAPRAPGPSTPFDAYLGRRLLTPPTTRSLPGTPRTEAESDLERASSLIALYELRAKLRQYNDSTSLRQAREKIDALAARHHIFETAAAAGTTSGSLDGTTSRPASAVLAGTSTPESNASSRRHTQYTYPRS